MRKTRMDQQKTMIWPIFTTQRSILKLTINICSATISIHAITQDMVAGILLPLVIIITVDIDQHIEGEEDTSVILLVPAQLLLKIQLKL